MKIKWYIRILGPLIFLFILFFYVDFNRLMEIILVLKWRYFWLSFAMVPGIIFVRSIRWQGIMSRFGIFYSVRQCFRIYFVEMVAIMVVATIGTFIKIFYLKRDGHGLLKPTLTVITDKYFDYLLPLIFGTASVFLVWTRLSPTPGFMLLVLITAAAFFPARLAVRLFSPGILPNRLKAFFGKKGWDIAENLSEVHNCLDLKTYFYSVIAFAIYFASIYFLNRGLLIDLSFFKVVLVMSITSLVTMIPISFLGIGTRDIGLIAVFKWFGHTPEQAVALSLALLLLRIVIVFMGSIFWFIDPPPLSALKQ